MRASVDHRRSVELNVIMGDETICSKCKKRSSEVQSCMDCKSVQCFDCIPEHLSRCYRCALYWRALHSDSVQAAIMVQVKAAIKAAIKARTASSSEQISEHGPLPIVQTVVCNNEVLDTQSCCSSEPVVPPKHRRTGRRHGARTRVIEGLSVGGIERESVEDERFMEFDVVEDHGEKEGCDGGLNDMNCFVTGPIKLQDDCVLDKERQRRSGEFPSECGGSPVCGRSVCGGLAEALRQDLVRRRLRVVGQIGKQVNEEAVESNIHPSILLGEIGR